MQFSRASIPTPYNEPMRDFAPGSEDAKKLQEACARIKKECPEIPCFVGGEEIKTGSTKKQFMPTDKKHALCTFHQADEKTLEKAIKVSLEAKKKWEELPHEDRAAIFLRAADLLAGKYRYDVLAATMLGQGKTVWQAEIDAAAETIDFFRFNVKYSEEIYKMQPPMNPKGVWNHTEYRPLEGYVVAISPFNFTAIGANLPTSPAMMGNVVLWKPSSTAVLSNWIVFQVLRESGLPDGVINFLPGSGATIGKVLINSPDFAGLHFTGSTEVFNSILEQTAKNQRTMYKSYPRIVGETGGKDFHFVHKTADVDHVVNCTIRGAFEYQGQKCSACSRAYFPSNLWPDIKKGLVEEISKIHMGQPDDFSTFMTAVIDQNAFNSIKGYIDWAKKDKDCEILVGGECDDSKGYFIKPTVIVCKNPGAKVMKEEIFGPVLSVYVYDEDKYEETLHLCDGGSPYSLTGALFAQDRYALDLGTKILRNASGNFYINDKCTGSIVGQQPFGGARASGTNDKAGSPLNLLRWVSCRSIKESFVPCTGWSYPHMGELPAAKSAAKSKRTEKEPSPRKKSKKN